MNQTTATPLPSRASAAASAGDLLKLALLAPLAGLGAGLIGALFRLALDHANDFRNHLITRLTPWGVGGVVVVILLAATAAALAAWLVRRVPSAAGSGIPRVMAVMDDAAPPAPARVVPVKFVAGTLAIGSGLALGREGPSVQMGASLAYQVGRWFHLQWIDCRALLAAGGGAGFAVAFNAPIAGALFVCEGLLKQFETRLVLAALAASAVAIWVGRAMFGSAPEYSVRVLAEPDLVKMPFFLLLGVGAGLAGVLYNRTLLGTLNLAARYPRLPVEGRAALVAVGIAALACFAPTLVGGGDALAQQALDGTGTLGLLPWLFLLRLGLIAVSVAAGTPGGLLVPFLSLGAELGLWFGLLFALLMPGLGFEPPGFALVGMAAIFTAIVRTPLTAIILVTEMTNDVTLLLPMIVACFAAVLTPALYGDRAILDALKDRFVAAENRSPNPAPAAPR